MYVVYNSVFLYFILFIGMHVSSQVAQMVHIILPDYNNHNSIINTPVMDMIRIYTRFFGYVLDLEWTQQVLQNKTTQY